MLNGRVIILLAAPIVLLLTLDTRRDPEDLLQAARDYVEGWYAGDAERVGRVLHPAFVRRIAAVTTSDEDFFLETDRDALLANARRGGDSATPEDEREIDIAVLDRARTTAVIRIDSAYYTEYLSLACLRGQWQVVHVLWENVPNDRIAIAPEPRVLASYAGRYRHDSGVEYEVVVEGDRLFIDPPHEPRSEFVPESETEFFTQDFKSGMTFVRDEKGVATALVIHQRGRDFRMERVPPD